MEVGGQKLLGNRELAGSYPPSAPYALAQRPGFGDHAVHLPISTAPGRGAARGARGQVVRSPLGVAEAGAVWLTQGELVVSALGVLSQHLVVLLDPAAIVATMHDAYGRIDLAASPYGVFMAGPSATGDIEGVIIHGAQGARSLTVLLLAPALG